MKMATPKTTPRKLKSNARLRCVKKRRAMSSGVSRRFRWRRRIDHALAHRLSGMKLVLIGNDYMIALCQATERLRKIECAKSHVDGSSLHNSPIYHQRLIDKQRACRH